MAQRAKAGLMLKKDVSASTKKTTLKHDDQASVLKRNDNVPTKTAIDAKLMLTFNPITKQPMFQLHIPKATSKPQASAAGSRTAALRAALTASPSAGNAQLVNLSTKKPCVGKAPTNIVIPLTKSEPVNSIALEFKASGSGKPSLVGATNISNLIHKPVRSVIAASKSIRNDSLKEHDYTRAQPTSPTTPPTTPPIKVVQLQSLPTTSPTQGLPLRGTTQYVFGFGANQPNTPDVLPIIIPPDKLYGPTEDQPADLGCVFCGKSTSGRLRNLHPHSAKQPDAKLIPGIIQETFGVLVDYSHLWNSKVCDSCIKFCLKAQRLRRHFLHRMSSSRPVPPDYNESIVQLPVAAVSSELCNRDTKDTKEVIDDDHTYGRKTDITEQADKIINKGGLLRYQYGDHLKAGIPKTSILYKFITDKDVRISIEQRILMEIQTTCNRLAAISQAPGPSVLRSGMDTLAQTDIVSSAILEMEHTMPFVLDILHTLCTGCHSVATNTKRTVATIYGMAMHCRNHTMSAIQNINALTVIRYEASIFRMMDALSKSSFTLTGTSNKARLIYTTATKYPHLGLKNEDGKLDEEAWENFIDQVLAAQKFTVSRKGAPLSGVTKVSTIKKESTVVRKENSVIKKERKDLKKENSKLKREVTYYRKRTSNEAWRSLEKYNAFVENRDSHILTGNWEDNPETPTCSEPGNINQDIQETPTGTGIKRKKPINTEGKRRKLFKKSQSACSNPSSVMAGDATDECHMSKDDSPSEDRQRESENVEEMVEEVSEVSLDEGEYVLHEQEIEEYIEDDQQYWMQIDEEDHTPQDQEVAVGTSSNNVTKTYVVDRQGKFALLHDSVNTSQNE